MPKKRGPKTDVLEALLKRVDGLEQKLKDQKSPSELTSPTAADVPPLPAPPQPPQPPPQQPPPAPGTASADETNSASASASAAAVSCAAPSDPKPACLDGDPPRPAEPARESAAYSPAGVSEPSPGVPAEALLDTYFARFHAKPYHVLDESTVRRRMQLGQLPSFLVHSIYAVAAR